MQLEKFDPIFNMEFSVMRPAFNTEHKHWVTMLTREEKTRELGTPPVVKGLSDLQMGPERWRGQGYSLWAIFGKKAQYFSRKECCSFSVEVYAILASVHEIQMNECRALKAPQAAKQSLHLYDSAKSH